MSFSPWQRPDPQTANGLNSIMVFGENIQVAVGLNHQVALGSNLQLCINPSTIFEMLDIPGTSKLSAVMGSGLGGNMQFTIGSSTNVTWGRSFTVNIGPESITIENTKQTPLAKKICKLIAVAVLAYALAYGLEHDENGKANIVIIFQVFIDLLLAALMLVEMAIKKADTVATDTLARLFNIGVTPAHAATDFEKFEKALAATAIVGAFVAIPVILGTEEGHFDGQTQDAAA